MTLAADVPSTRHLTLRTLARTILIFSGLWFGLMVYVLLLGPFLLIAGSTFDKRRILARRTAKFIFPGIVRTYCFFFRPPVALDIQRIDWKSLSPCIIVANHSSMLDIIMLMMLPTGIGDGRVWAKDWPFRVPLLGWLMKLSGHLFVEDFNILPDARDVLSDGTSLLVFPESSRSRSGKIARFREGAFLLAARSGRPIVPIALHGTHACFPPGQGWIHTPSLRVEALGILRPDPIDPKPHATLRRQAHSMIATALGQKNSAEQSPTKSAAA